MRRYDGFVAEHLENVGGSPQWILRSFGDVLPVPMSSLLADILPILLGIGVCLDAYESLGWFQLRVPGDHRQVSEEVAAVFVGLPFRADDRVGVLLR